MKTMEKLCRKFNQMYPDYHADFICEDSYPGYYTVVITEPVCGLPAYMHFHTCKEFREWIDGVVLD